MRPKVAPLRLTVALVLAGAALSLGSQAAADCAAPSVHVSPRRVVPGDELSVTGDSWGDACNDTPGPVCNPPPLGDPIEDVRLGLWAAGEGTVHFGTLDADEEYSFDATVEVPDVPPGTYSLRATGDEHVADARVVVVRD